MCSFRSICCMFQYSIILGFRVIYCLRQFRLVRVAIGSLSLVHVLHSIIKFISYHRITHRISYMVSEVNIFFYK